MPEGKDATDFLAKNGCPWSNFHDEGEYGEAWGGPFGIPRVILIDSTGKIVYDKAGYRKDELLAAYAGLGPGYAFLSPNPKQAPGVASK